MEAQTNALIERLAAAGPGWACAGLALAAFLENLVPPVPGDTVVLFGAYLVGRGALAWVPVFLATWAGGTAGFMTMYAIGYTGGRAWVTRHWGASRAASLERAERWLARYGVGLILVNRFLSGVRTAIALVAGIGRMGWRTVLLGAAVSMALWNGLLLGVGVGLGRNWKAAADLLRTGNRVVLAAGLLVGVGVVVWGWRRRRAGRAQP
jgi:membrane protein DedA with SNARE-associated domain